MRDGLRRAHADPGRLHIQHLQQRVVVLVEQNGRAGQALQLHGAAHMVDVGVGHDNLLHRQAVALHDSHHVVDVVARVDDDGFLGLLIAHHRAVALQRADRKNLVNHTSKLP